MVNFTFLDVCDLLLIFVSIMVYFVDLDHPTFILGKTSAPHLKTINNNNNNITVEVETVYVPSAKTAQTAALSSRRQEPAIEADVRMPKNVPQVNVV